jgi:hypothetical protein
VAKVFISFWLFSYSILGINPNNQQFVRDEVIAKAESQLYVVELTGNNDGVEVENYLALTGLPKGYAWCAAFVSWVYYESGVKTTISARAVDFFKDKLIYKLGSLDKTAINNGQKGDVFGLYYNNLGRIGHIGMIEGGDKNNYYSIEGNTNKDGEREGQGVERKIRPKKMMYAISDKITK